jgi:RNA polymerase sigma factor (sigma-70 family)
MGGMPLPASACTDQDLTDPQLLDRFVTTQDAAAFGSLIRRHGPVVLGVCRRVLNHEQEAEDAFQATFLVLVRRAASLERPELLGNWLYGVAYRTAQKARARLARRRHHEKQVVPMSSCEPSDDLGWREVRGVLDEELRHLPPKYRAPLVLCYLEGMTNEEAARRLGWPVGSMSYRLARGRQLLRDRLSQRRQRLSGIMLLALLKQHAGPEDVPDDLAEATLRAALGHSGDDMPIPPLVPHIESTPTPPAPPSTVSAQPRRGVLRPLLIILATLAVAGAAYAAVSTDGFTNWQGWPWHSEPVAPCCH